MVSPAICELQQRYTEITMPVNKIIFFITDYALFLCNPSIN
jgi:hypothetical protein